MASEKLLYLATSFASQFINAAQAKPTSPRRILVVKLDEIGDMIYAMHCLEALRSSFPDSEITMWCKPMNNALVQQTGAVNHLVHTRGDLKGKFDVQIDLRGSWESLRFAFLGGAKYYLERGSIRFRNKFSGGQIHETLTNQAILAPLLPNDFEWVHPSFHIDEETLTRIGQLLKSNHLSRYVLMHCGARDASRRWPTERFSQLVDSIFERYGLKTVFIGSPNETELVEEVSSRTANAINLAGKTNLMELAALCRRAEFFVGNESGPLHFAIVEKKPLVALFGPGVKDVFYPLYASQRVIHHFLEKDHTKQTVDNSTILRISVADVLHEIEQIYSVD
ncbi:MAG: glycosyltransferase family 9 protein [Bacteroidia bacterium]|nr:glycosyltransferase family 9 protein [Bacteroidia bacterium]